VCVTRSRVYGVRKLPSSEIWGVSKIRALVFQHKFVPQFVKVKLSSFA